ncbi:MAG TPA: acyl-CoA dehydrogenase family protein [Candidatus Dormibacteraeota bacterium]|nr:acyl-CoA dehydrogenase family protein [Candidatus Dormibacteraeota bacterium]
MRQFLRRGGHPGHQRLLGARRVPPQLVPKLAGLSIAGGTIKGYGCPGMSPVAVGLVGMELSRGDGSVSTFFGVHSGFAMQSIAMLGSPAQR